ncbi:hypothetical protein KIPB_010822 [Kipferlia bialata]|uniref:Uncharacterized protein n=1 Tax=Kipferlia bialata TaxID=797122 RepID=A0A9K3D3N2_9EUKA|nr:hypothetical protein KIPB_010822 [Kipferlia bialata]|eukprot:g10822.t1
MGAEKDRLQQQIATLSSQKVALTYSIATLSSQKVALSDQLRQTASSKQHAEAEAVTAREETERVRSALTVAERELQTERQRGGEARDQLRVASSEVTRYEGVLSGIRTLMKGVDGPGQKGPPGGERERERETRREESSDGSTGSSGRSSSVYGGGGKGASRTGVDSTSRPVPSTTQQQQQPSGGASTNSTYMYGVHPSSIPPSTSLSAPQPHPLNAPSAVPSGAPSAGDGTVIHSSPPSAVQHTTQGRRSAYDRPQNLYSQVPSSQVQQPQQGSLYMASAPTTTTAAPVPSAGLYTPVQASVPVAQPANPYQRQNPGPGHQRPGERGAERERERGRSSNAFGLPPEITSMGGNQYQGYK